MNVVSRFRIEPLLSNTAWCVLGYSHALPEKTEYTSPGIIIFRLSLNFAAKDVADAFFL